MGQKEKKRHTLLLWIPETPIDMQFSPGVTQNYDQAVFLKTFLILESIINLIFYHIKQSR